MLKEDYKDDLYDGQRRYRMIQNEDGTYGLPDATSYTQKGDRFGANDINSTNQAINKARKQRTITLTAAGWSSVYPFTQVVTLEGISAEDNIKVIGVHISAGATLEQVKAQNKAAGFLICNPDGVTDGKMTFKAYKKPVVDFQIITEGG